MRTSKSIFIVTGIIFLKLLSYGQPPAIQWAHCYGGSQIEAAYSIEQDYDGFIIAGFTGSNDYDVSGHHGPVCSNVNCLDWWLLKIDFNGNIVWEKSFGGTGGDWAYDVIPTRDSGYVACGLTWSNDGDVTGNHSSLIDLWVIKTDHSGNLLWQKCYGGTGTEVGSAVVQTRDGGYAITGCCYSNNGDVTGHHGDSTISDIWVIKIDSIGNLQWQRSLGGTNDGEWGKAIYELKNGNIAILGTASSIDGDVTNLHVVTYNYRDFWFIILDSTGSNILWQNCFGGYLGSQSGLSMDVSEDHGFIMTGTTDYDTGFVAGYHGGINSGYDAFIVKIDSLGNVQNNKCFGGTFTDYGSCIRQTYDNGYVFTGETKSNDGDIFGNHGWSDVNIIKLDSAFNIQWQKCLGGIGPEESYSIIQVSDSGFLISGYASVNDGDVSGNHGVSDFWIVKLAPDPLHVNINSSPIIEFNAFLSFNKVMISFFASKNETVNLRLFDIAGRLIYQYPFKAQRGFNKGELNTGLMSEGVYIVHLDTENETLIKKVLKY